MSENIPEPSTSATFDRKKSSKRKYDKNKLPTPPPDPIEDCNDSEIQNVFEHLDTLTRSTSTYASVLATEEAFDHLEKLYRLMEQMLEIREQNSKLHKRIRDLEQLNNLTQLHKQLELGIQRECPEVERDTAFAETILELILMEIKKEQKQSNTPRLRTSILRRQRNRSGSATEKAASLDTDNADFSGSRTDKSSKVSKWTKVKAAFKWEKASSSVAEKANDGGLTPVNMEVARYLRVPSTSDDTGHSPVDSITAELSTPGSLSTASSNEDFHRMGTTEGFRSSEDENPFNYIPQSKDDANNKSNLKLSRTPWAKMKDIIQTRNSFKKKHRLSTHSDDVHLTGGYCTDNEEVFYDDTKCKSAQLSPQASQYSKVYIRADSYDIPKEIFERYQRVLADDTSANETDSKKISKWTRVKKAFLSNELNNISSSPKKEQNIEDEIKQNYRQLQKKLSLEFQEKRNEWERLKQNSPNALNTTFSYIDESKDPNFVKKMEEWKKIKSQPVNKNKPNIEITRKEDLPPEFKKKMQEWERIKKLSGKETSTTKKKLGEVPRWKSVSDYRSHNSPSFELPPLSDDFKKKIEEWKQIKAGGGIATSDTLAKKLNDKTPSPKLSRKNSSPKHSKKNKDNIELHWFEKELNKIEKEKQRLEKERQKYLEKEERLTKRKNTSNDNKQEVLVHTPSGLYRFEGISRKFQQKLYEWEKAQGIGPESSTFALLSSCNQNNEKPFIHSHSNSPPLIRSKSADSIAKSASIFTCPIISQQPSSLSLNDVEEFENECLSDSKSLSVNYLNNSTEELEQDEPEALIVEVEDYVEETAAPLRTYIKQQKPIYQRQEIKPMCESETIAAPKVRRSESTRAQVNYNIIEDIFKMLQILLEDEYKIKKLIEDGSCSEQNANLSKIKEFCEKEKQCSKTLTEKLLKLQEANTTITSTLNTDENTNASKPSKVIEILEAVQDHSSEIYQLSEKLEMEFGNRILENDLENITFKHNFIIETIIGIRYKMMELRRHLSYACAATDTTIPERKKTTEKVKTPLHETLSSESRESRCDTSDNSLRPSEKRSNEERRYIKSDTCNVESQGAVKKRIKYRQKTSQNRSFPDTDEEDDINEKRKNKPKKLCRTRSTSESSVGKIKATEREAGFDFENVDCKTTAVSSEANFVSALSSNTIVSESPVTVFVKTTRKLFTPIGEANLPNNLVKPNLENTNDDIGLGENQTEDEYDEKHNNETKEIIINLQTLSSPASQRKNLKEKEISPSIKLMLAKYNQKISEQDTSPKSAAGSGSASPTVWRSPTAERRVKAQTEKYQEVLSKGSPLLSFRPEVQKSASMNSAFCLSSNERRKNLTLNLDFVKDNAIRENRTSKLQKAKEEFLSSPLSAPPQINNDDILKYPTRNRLSQISVDSESSYDSIHVGTLIKSASAGMINIDPDTYKQFDPEYHGGGYVSLPRSPRKHKEGFLSGKFAFANIASKFRKVRMRRGKEKMNAVSTLCRQSLVVDITPMDESDRLTSSLSANASSEDISQSTSKLGSWMKKPNFFKK